MTPEMRKTGVDVVGDMPWGTHFCLFYETQADLLETLVSYCKAGLENQEFCLWVVAEPLTVEGAKCALKRAVPDFDRYFEDHSIEIVAARDWYLQDGSFDLNRVISGWNEKLARASARGYAGVRVTGDTAWLEKKDWKDFCEYEESLNQAIAGQRLAVLCTYPLAACGAAEILDVVRTHQFAVTKRRGSWDVIETAGHKQAKAEIKRLNEELEQRVLERTSQLTAVNRELTKEVFQRQLAEEALQRSEAYLAEAQRISHTGSFGWDVSSGQIFWSEETFRIFEYNQTVQPTVELVLHRTHPEDQALVRQSIDRAVQQRMPFDFEHRMLMPDGSTKYVRVMGHPAIKAGTGDVKFVGAITDITDRKRAEDAVRASEKSLRLIVDRIPGLVCTMTATGDVEGVNQQIVDYTGKILEELQDWRPLVHPDDLARVMTLWVRSVETGHPYEVEHRILRADGVYRWFHVHGLPLRDKEGRIVRWYNLLTDIDERKKAEEKLQQSETELRQLIDVIPHQVFVFDANWSPLFANRRELEYTGLTLQEVQSKDAVAKVFHPADLKKLEVLRERVLSAVAPFEMEARIRGKDGQYRWFLIRDNPLQDEQGRVLQWYGTRTDIEDRKRAEETLRQAQADLAHVSRVTAMGELTASLAHEVNQPIAAAITNANTCLRWLTRDRPDVEEACAAASRVVKDGMRAADIISRIRLMFKKGAPQRELVNVNDVIREMIVLLRNETTRYSISVRTELAADLPQVVVDRVQLQQVLMNLMINGIDAMKKTTGGGELAFKSEAGDGQLLISVSDTGVGLPPGQADQIFRTFFTTKDNGTGMGLPISRSIIESHGGRLWATGAPGSGATFQFTLPATAAAHA